MVTIPQGNYDNQKIIIGKQATKDNTPLVYKSPMENMVNLTNNIIPDNSNLRVEMWANSSDYAWNEGSKLSESEVYTAVEDDKLKYCLWDSNDCSTEIFYQKYDVLGLSAQFSTWLNEYNTVTGNYGLILEVTFKDLNTQENFAKIYSCQFDSDEFFGDVYNFETYYTQEKVFNLSDYKDSVIVRLRLFPYQRCNFTTIEGEDVPYPDADDFSNIPPNIYMKDFMISLGSYVSETTEDTAEIMTDSSMTYDKNIQNDLSEYDPVWITNYLLNNKSLLPLNTELVTYGLIQLLNSYNSGEIIKIEHEAEFKRLLQNCDYENIEDNFIIPIMNERNRETNNLKYINLRWVHIFEDAIKVVEENEIPEDYEIRWYRYKPGAPSPDQFSGAHWEYLAAAGEESSTLNKITVEFQPNVNNNEEKIKVIIIKKEEDVQGNLKEYKIATSNVLEFTNNTQIRDSITFEDISALTLRIDDNFHGNYLLYDRSGKLGKNEWDTEYSITALFEGQPLAVEDCSLIEWTIPTENTMIKSYKPIGEKDNIIYYYIKNYLDNNAINNTISLKIIKDGLEYAAAAALRFGTAGTNGSNYTMALIWDDDKKAIDVQPDEFKNYTFNEGDKLSIEDQDKYALKGTLYVYDQSGSPVDLSSATIELSWATAVDCNLLKNNSADSTNNYVFENEEEDIYYPVFITNDQNSLQPLTSFIGGFSIRQPDPTNENARYKDFYYFKQSNFDFQHHTYKKFNLENKTFEDFILTNGVPYGAIYRKKYGTGFKKKIEFKQVSVVNSSEEVVSGKTVLYNSQKRYFIKYNNQYILDPWDEYQSSETYYEPILAAPRIDDSNQSGSSQLIANIDGQRVTISYEVPFNNLNYIYILKITLNNFGDYPLIIYKPIALTRTQETSLIVNYINGPEDVRYATTGETDFNKNPYEIEVTYIHSETDSEIIKYYYNEELNQDQTKILNSNTAPEGETLDPIPEGTGGTPEHQNLRGYWRLIIAENYDKWDPAEEDNQFYPSLKETALGWFKQPDNNATYNVQKIKEGQKRSLQSRDWLTYHKPILKPPAIYYKDAAPYAVQFIRFDGKTLWTQPIFVYQDNYPSTTLNQWNGKDIITDNDTGTIVANGFAAGHKNSDNTFSGVVLGDWSRTDIDRSFAVNETGVYGFNHGAMSYALKDDGTAFFGKDGRGRIYIDGNNATIKSASWRYDKPEGMMIDLDDGILDTRSQNSQVYISPNSNRLLDIQVTKDGEKKDIFYVGDSSYYLKTANFNDTHDENGHGTKIDLVNGTISSYDLNLTGYKKLKYTSQDLEDYRAAHNNASPSWNVGDIKPDLQSIKIDVNDAYGYPLAIGKPNDRSFLVSWDGRLLLKNSKNEGTNDTPRYISLNCSSRYNNIYPLAIGTTSAEENREFKVGWDGKLYAQGAEISGIISATSGEIGGWKISSNDLTKTTKINDTDINYDKVIISADPAHNWGGYALGIFSHDSNGDHQTLRIKYDGTIIQGSDSEYKFKVEPNGNLIAKAGSVGGWTISSDSISKTMGTGSTRYYTKLLSNPTANTNKAIEIGIGDNPDFYVQYNGYMYANSGKIGNWTISSGALTRTVGSNTISIGASDTSINANNAFKVNASGYVYASNLHCPSIYMLHNNQYKELTAQTVTINVPNHFEPTINAHSLQIKAKKINGVWVLVPDSDPSVGSATDYTCTYTLSHSGIDLHEVSSNYTYTLIKI